MKNLWLVISTILLSLGVVHAQEKLFLQSSSHSRLNTETGMMINYVPVYLHKGSTLRADSGFIYSDTLKRDFFDAYGNVTITQPNGTMIFANKLNYAEETQIAVLTGNVRMVDGNSVLTTNYLTYNLRSDVGTYLNGGRIVNEKDTITSERAWYFNQTKDAYFRLGVVVRTPDVQIYTDTMRYNTESKTTYFYGPTNIKGKKGENLYTEEGNYNTQTEQAAFYKKNLYTETSRMLRGDTLLYDGKSGNGRALSYVLFVDTVDRFFVEGMEGVYNKGDESILMTNRALVTFVVEESSKSDSSSKMVTDSTRVEIEESDLEATVGLSEKPVGMDSLLVESKKVDSVYLTADTLYSRMILLRDYEALDFQLDREGGALDVEEEVNFEGEEGLSENRRVMDSLRNASLALDSLGRESTGVIDSLGRDSTRMIDSLGRDSTSMIDSLASKMNDLFTQTELDKKIQSLVYEERIEAELKADSLLRKEAPIPKGGEVDSLLVEMATAMAKPLPKDSLPRDSAALDTARTRIVKAYKHVRLYKSDLQTVADSAFFCYADSMLRFFGSPMAWTQGSQLSGDSLFLQIKNEKIDNLVILRNAFVANTKQDSSKFNQIKGRRITGFFSNGELERVFVDGNAENIAYRENDTGTGYTDMYHGRSARIKILIRNNELTDFIPIKATEGTIYPLSLVPQEKEILEGFVWKPGDRPKSKADLLNRKRVISQEVIKSEDEEQSEDPKDDETNL